MKKLIIMMGHLAAYKTTIANQLAMDLGLLFFNKDEIKEVLTDDIGYQTRSDNLKLSAASFSILKLTAQNAIIRGLPILLESNFKYDELDQLKPLIEKENVDVLTIFLTANPKTLYERYTKRQVNRHIAHTSTGLMSYDLYKESMIEYNPDYLLGDNHLIDTTTFDDIDYLNLKNISQNFIFK